MNIRYFSILFFFMISPIFANPFITSDQQAQKLLQQGDAAAAEKTFNNPPWRAVSAYRAGHYEQAANTWAHDNSADGQYNRGNALAQLGDIPNAIHAYERALQIDPHHTDAAFNKALLEKTQEKKSNSHQQQPFNSTNNITPQQQKESSEKKPDSK